MHLGDPCFRAVVIDGARQALEVGDAALAAAALMVSPRMAWTRGVPVDEDRMEIITAARPLVAPDDWLTTLRLLLSHAEQLLFMGDRDGRMALLDEALDILDTRPLPPGTLTEAVGWLGMLMPATARKDIDGLMDRAKAEVDATGNTLQRLRNTWLQWNLAVRRGDRASYDLATARLVDQQAEAMSTPVETLVRMMEIIDGQLFGRLDDVDAAAARLVEISTAQDDETGRQLPGALRVHDRSGARHAGRDPGGAGGACTRPISAGPTAAVRASGLARVGRHGPRPGRARGRPARSTTSPTTRATRSPCASSPTPR